MDPVVSLPDLFGEGSRDPCVGPPPAAVSSVNVLSVEAVVDFPVRAGEVSLHPCIGPAAALWPVVSLVVAAVVVVVVAAVVVVVLAAGGGSGNRCADPMAASFVSVCISWNEWY